MTRNSFSSTNTYETYLKSEARTGLENTCFRNELITQPVEIQHLQTVAGFPFRDPGPFSAAGIHVAIAKIEYAPGTRSSGIEHWKHVAQSVEETEREGTYTYWFLTDPTSEITLYSLERYRDESYLWDMHVPSKAIQENIKNQKSIRTGLVLRGFQSVEGSI